MKIGVLAWGSLVWRRLSVAIVGEFDSIGPRLPIEFSRVSNDGRLTLVIDEAFSASCATYASARAFDDLLAAIENLRVREGMPSPKGVGFVELASGQQNAVAVQRNPQTVETIRAWAIANGYDAAIWTALASNFHESGKANAPFSVEAAVQYLETRDTPTLDAALTYIRQAPPEVQTPVHAAVTMRWPEG